MSGINNGVANQRKLMAWRLKSYSGANQSSGNGVMSM